MCERAFYGFISMCVSHFILCSSVSVDECVLEADYTQGNVYICAIKLRNQIQRGRPDVDLENERFCVGGDLLGLLRPRREKGRASLQSPPTVTHTPSVSVGLYPQPPAACLEQQQRETVGSQRSWQGGRETVGERKEEGRERILSFMLLKGKVKVTPSFTSTLKTSLST